MPTVGVTDIWRGAQAFESLFPERTNRRNRKSAGDKFHRARISASEVEWFLRLGNRRYPVPRQLAIKMIFALERAFKEFKAPAGIVIPMLDYINRWSAYKRSVLIAPSYYRVLSQVLRTGAYNSHRMMSAQESALARKRGYG